MFSCATEDSGNAMDGKDEFLTSEDLTGLGGGGTEGRGRLANLGLMCIVWDVGTAGLWGLPGGLALNLGFRRTLLACLELELYTGGGTEGALLAEKFGLICTLAEENMGFMWGWGGRGVWEYILDLGLLLESDMILLFEIFLDQINNLTQLIIFVIRQSNFNLAET